ncbi:hypothetical protein PFISCL1PPCAC_693, partial [Pristionchus fissidentatus]
QEYCANVRSMQLLYLLHQLKHILKRCPSMTLTSSMPAKEMRMVEAFCTSLKINCTKFTLNYTYRTKRASLSHSITNIIKPNILELPYNERMKPRSDFLLDTVNVVNEMILHNLPEIDNWTEFILDILRKSCSKLTIHRRISLDQDEIDDLIRGIREMNKKITFHAIITGRDE